MNVFVSIKMCGLCRLVASELKTSLIYETTLIAGLVQPEGTLVGYGVEFAPLNALMLGTRLSWIVGCLHAMAHN